MHMTRNNCVPNPYRTALHSQCLPDGDLTPRQRAIADAVQHCQSLSDFITAPAEVITSIHVVTVRLGEAPEWTTRRIEEGIAKARRELDHLESYYKAYGVEGFTPKPSCVPAKQLAAPDRRGIIVNLLRWCALHGQVLLQAGDKAVVRDASNAYCVIEKEAET